MSLVQSLVSSLAPQSSAIPQSKITSYPREWRDGACSGKYSYIPSYQGWRRGAGKYSTIPSQMEWHQGMLPEPSRMFDAEA